MAVMKQIDICLTRFFSNEPSLKKKWFAALNGTHLLYLFHYHHLVLVYDFKSNEILFEWWERDADKRGLDSAKEWLSYNDELKRDFLYLTTNQGE